MEFFRYEAEKKEITGENYFNGTLEAVSKEIF